MNQQQDGQLLADRALYALQEVLQQGILREGQFLSMPQLVEILGFPMAVVREAVKQASAQGVLVTVPKRGVQVMEARPETIRECLDFRMVLDQEGARRRIAADELDGLEALIARHREVLDQARDSAAGGLPPIAIAVDLSLHDFLAEGLGNSRLESDYADNRLRMAVIQNSRPFLQVRIASAMEEHLAIMDALRRRDAEGAVSAIRIHCEQTLHWWGIS
jgi:DNA-binding GntR family transcriptional regulator